MNNLWVGIITISLVLIMTFLGPLILNFLVLLMMDRTERKALGGKNLQEYLNEKRKETTILSDSE